MNTIILNGSPKLDPQTSNTQLFCEAFIENMKTQCEIRRISGSNYDDLAAYIQTFDEVLIFMPLYIHAMPGIVMKFFEALKPVQAGKKIGFIIQAGFTETAQSNYVTAYLENMAIKLHYQYLGTVTKGECAGIVEMPNMYKKTLKMVRDLGERYEQTTAFDKDITTRMAIPYELSKRQVKLFTLACNLGINSIPWHKKLRANHAFEKRLDRPFL